MSQRDLAYCSVCQQTLKNQQHTSVRLFVTSGEICHCPSVKPVTSNKLRLPDKACVSKRAPIVEGQSTMTWMPGLLLLPQRLGWIRNALCRSSWQARQVNSLAWCPLALPVDSGSTGTSFVRDRRELCSTSCNKSSCFYELECTLASKESRSAPIRYSVSVSAPILAFSAGSGYRSDETDPNPILCVYYCVIVKPHKSHKHIIVFSLFHLFIQGQCTKKLLCQS